MKAVCIFVSLVVAIKADYHDEVGIPLAAKIKALEDKIMQEVPDMESRVVGGQVAPVGAHPYLVGLVISIKNKEFAFSVCGSSLVSATRLVTAAHCVDRAARILTVLGSQYLHYGGTRIATDVFVKHPTYDRNDPDSFDVGVVSLPEPVEFSVSATRLVTAAHCVDRAARILTVLGSQYLHYGGTRIATDVFVKHPTYDRNDPDSFDVGVVSLPEPVEFSVSATRLVTAAHCVDRAARIVTVLGSQYLHYGGTRIATDVFVKHPMYRPGVPDSFDVGVVSLPEPVEFFVSATRLVTAAHCVDRAARIMTVLGSQYLHYGGTRIATDVFVKHPMYDRNDPDSFDVGVVSLPEPVEFSEIIKPISLPLTPDDAEKIGEWGVAAGYGMSSDEQSRVPVNSAVRQVKLKIISDEECKKHYGQGAVTNSWVCTSGDKQVGTCGGDSGGPFIVERKGRKILVGLTSLGATYCEIGLPSAFTRVATYLDFIKKHL